MPPSICCQPGSSTNCVNSAYLTAPGTDVQLRSIAFVPAAVAVSTGAVSVVEDCVALAVGVLVDVAASEEGTVSVGKFDHGPSG